MALLTTAHILAGLKDCSPDGPQNDASSTNKSFVHKRDNIVIYVDCVQAIASAI
jgi:hypothetical protein